MAGGKKVDTPHPNPEIENLAECAAVWWEKGIAKFHGNRAFKSKRWHQRSFAHRAGYRNLVTELYKLFKAERVKRQIEQEVLDEIQEVKKEMIEPKVIIKKPVSAKKEFPKLDNYTRPDLLKWLKGS